MLRKKGVEKKSAAFFHLIYVLPPSHFLRDGFLPVNRKQYSHMFCQPVAQWSDSIGKGGQHHSIRIFITEPLFFQFFLFCKKTRRQLYNCTQIRLFFRVVCLIFFRPKFQFKAFFKLENSYKSNLIPFQIKKVLKCEKIYQYESMTESFLSLLLTTVHWLVYIGIHKKNSLKGSATYLSN